MAKTRNYKKEYANYHAKPLQKVNRAGRNKARKIVMKAGGTAKVAGKDVHHKNGIRVVQKQFNLYLRHQE